MKYINVTLRWATMVLMIISIFTISACNDDDDPPGPTLNGNNTVYSLFEVGNSGISGTVTFAELSDGNTRIVVDLDGTSAGGMHPSHIHLNTAAEGGGIAISLEEIDGSLGTSTTDVEETDSGTPITYNELIAFDGYVNVHESNENLATLLAQGDIGQNVLTGDSETYTLDERNDSGVSGSVRFWERLNGETLVVVELTGTPADGDHPAHIHANTAAEGGGIVVSLENIDGSTGLSRTNVTQTDEGTALSYDDLIVFDGYVNVHLSPSELGTTVAQGDIGQNAFTGNSETYDLEERSGSGVSGSVHFRERLNGETLVVVELTGTPADGDHPAHIHANTAAEGGGIVVSLENIDGSTGLSRTNITQTDDGTALTYADLIDFDGYVNVHLSPSELGTTVAQGDIGQNALTGESVSYAMGGSATGTAVFYERNNGETLVVLSLADYAFTGDHPSHIHAGSIASPGSIAISLSAVNAEGISRTSVSALDDETAISYEELLVYDGYINVHLSEADLATLISQGDIGSNG